MAMTLEHFVCLRLPGTPRLTRAACAAKFAKTSRRQDRTRGDDHCIGCRVGAQHVRGEKPAAWPDGEPLELVQIQLGSDADPDADAPPPGRSSWLGGSATPAAAAAAAARTPDTTSRSEEPPDSSPAPRTPPRGEGSGGSSGRERQPPEGSMKGLRNIKCARCGREVINAHPKRKYCEGCSKKPKTATKKKRRTKRAGSTRRTKAESGQRLNDLFESGGARAPDPNAPALEVELRAAGVVVARSTEASTWAEVLEVLRGEA